MIPRLVATAVAAGTGIAGFFLGFLIAAIMSASSKADAQLEEMRRRHAGRVADWMDSKIEEAQAQLELSKGGSK